MQKKNRKIYLGLLEKYISADFHIVVKKNLYIVKITQRYKMWYVVKYVHFSFNCLYLNCNTVQVHVFKVSFIYCLAPLNQHTCAFCFQCVYGQNKIVQNIQLVVIIFKSFTRWTLIPQNLCRKSKNQCYLTCLEAKIHVTWKAMICRGK